MYVCRVKKISIPINSIHCTPLKDLINFKRTPNAAPSWFVHLPEHRIFHKIISYLSRSVYILTSRES